MDGHDRMADAFDLDEHEAEQDLPMTAEQQAGAPRRDAEDIERRQSGRAELDEQGNE